MSHSELKIDICCVVSKYYVLAFNKENLNLQSIRRVKGILYDSCLCMSIQCLYIKLELFSSVIFVLIIFIEI